MVQFGICILILSVTHCDWVGKRMDFPNKTENLPIPLKLSFLDELVHVPFDVRPWNAEPSGGSLDNQVPVNVKCS